MSFHDLIIRCSFYFNRRMFTFTSLLNNLAILGVIQMRLKIPLRQGIQNCKPDRLGAFSSFNRYIPEQRQSYFAYDDGLGFKLPGSFSVLNLL